MNKIYKIFAVLILVISISSCSNFLEEYSEDLSYVTDLKDLEEVLIGECYMKNVENSDAYTSALAPTEGKFYFSMMNVMDDDISEYLNNSYIGSRTYLKRFHNWHKNTYVYQDSEYELNDWHKVYRHIASSNIVIKKADEFKDDIEKSNRIKGEGYFLRASYYYILANLFCNPYEKSTAMTVKGIPLKNTEYVEDKHFTRNSLQEVYSQIESDLIKSIENLKGLTTISIYRANYFAANAFLSRLYLSMGEWEKSIKYSDIVLNEGSYSLENLNGFDNQNSFLCRSSKGLIYSQGTNCMDALMEATGGDTYKVSADLLLQYSNDDLRRNVFFETIVDGTNTRQRCNKLKAREHGIVSDIFSFRIAEMLLNKAESLAMLGRGSEAKVILNDIRTNRIDSDTYTDVSSADGSDLITEIRNERRREFCFEGSRWFDLKRYAVNMIYPSTKEIVHASYSQIGIGEIYELSGYSKLGKFGSDDGYLLQIPKEVLDFNETMIANPLRPVRILSQIK